jgi:transcriptional regulator with XRE-family HTH domain
MLAGMDLAAYRNRDKVTLQALADQCGVTPSTVAKWERGACFPRPEQIDAIEQATRGEVTAADLLAKYRAASSA